MLNFVAIRKGISSTPGTSVLYLVIKKGLPQTRKQKYGKMFAPLHIKGKWLRVGMNFASGKAPLVFQKWHSALLLPNDLQTNETEWLAAVTHRYKVSTIY